MDVDDRQLEQHRLTFKSNCAGYSAAAYDEVTMTGCGSTSLWEQFTVAADGPVNT